MQTGLLLYSISNVRIPGPFFHVSLLKNQLLSTLTAAVAAMAFVGKGDSVGGRVAKLYGQDDYLTSADIFTGAVGRNSCTGNSDGFAGLLNWVAYLSFFLFCIYSIFC